MKQVQGLRWWIITLIGIATVINYIDRNSLAVMWPDISRDLSLSKDEYAAILSFFMVAYAIGQSVSGRLIDAVGTRIGFTLTIVVWSLSCALHGLARNLASFGLFRALLGLSEAGAWPGATKSNAEWFPVRERAFAQGIFNAGASLGAVISAPLVAVLYLSLGWKATFVAIGTLGFAWVLPWWFLNKAVPERHPWISREERALILEGRTARGEGEGAEERVPGWGELLAYRPSWAVIVSRFFLDPIWWMFVNWLPIYLTEQFGFDIKQIGLFAWVLALLHLVPEDPALGTALAASVVGGVRATVRRPSSKDQLQPCSTARSAVRC